MASLIRCVNTKTTVVPVTYLHSRLLASHAAVATPQHGHEDHADSHGHDSHGHGPYVPPYRELIGKREIVGFGWNGEPGYGDSMVWPYPPVRFREPDAKYEALVKKEKGSWKNLSKEEKKELYRYNYCETFSEMFAPSGQWKSIVGTVCMGLALALVAFCMQKKLYGPLPDSFSDESRLAQLKRMIDLRVGAVDGLGSKWDYEKGRWKE